MACSLSESEQKYLEPGVLPTTAEPVFTQKQLPVHMGSPGAVVKERLKERRE